MGNPVWGKQGSWDETEACLNQQIAQCNGADAVEKGTIRRWLETKEFDCPLHFDEATAKDAGYEGVVAPGVMAITYGIPAYWQPGDPHSETGYEPKQIPMPVVFDVPAPCPRAFATSMELEFFAPMCLGDQLTCTSKLVNIKHKPLSVGEGAFLKQEDTYTNQKGEVVAISYIDIFRFVPQNEQGE